MLDNERESRSLSFEIGYTNKVMGRDEETEGPCLMKKTKSISPTTSDVGEAHTYSF